MNTEVPQRRNFAEMSSVREIAISAIAVCAIAMAMLGNHKSGNDVHSGLVAKLFAFTIAAVVSWTFFRFTRKAPRNEPVSCVARDESQFDTSKHVELMRKFAVERNVGGAMRTFGLIKQSGSPSSLMYNIVLQACINSGNIQAAEDWMDEVKDAGMADQSSFQILIKALVASHNIQKAYDILMSMRGAGVQPEITTINEVLGGFARENLIGQAFSMLKEMNIKSDEQWDGVQANSVTLNAIVKLINASRDTNIKLDFVQGILSKYKLEANTREARSAARRSSNLESPLPVPLPFLSGVAAHSKDAKEASCAHHIEVAGSLSKIKAVRRTLKQLGFLDKEKGPWPLDGHWETSHGLTVVIEGKMVRWSGRHASKLRFTSQDRTACVLSLYREATQGQLVEGHGPMTQISLRWSNGDIWYPCDGRAIGQHVLCCQTMSRTSRDEMQQQLYRARARAVLKCVSRQALQMPAVFEDAITQFLGIDLYFVRIRFESSWNPSKVDEDELPISDSSTDICDSISRRHPQIGLRHCWADRSADACGQRALVNGEELDEPCFNRHIGAVSWA